MKLGLPMCKRHLDEISGQIAVESKESEGTVVQIKVPEWVCSNLSLLDPVVL